MPRFRSVHRHAKDADVAERLAATAPPMEGGVLLGIEATATASLQFEDDISAARHYLESLAEPATIAGGLLSIEEAAPATPKELRPTGVTELRDEPNRLVFFDQRIEGLPVLGAKAIVELGAGRRFVAMNAQLTDDRPSLGPPTLEPEDAIERVAAKAAVEVGALADVPTPELTYYQDDDGEWHLVYEVLHVQALPPEFREATRRQAGHMLASSPAFDFMKLTYLVDAHSGEVVVYYSETAWIDDPTKCKGIDELAASQDFYGFLTATGAFELRDPVRNIRTFDNKFGNIKQSNFATPAGPVAHTSYDFATTNTAAVSAHVNATRVFDFFNGVLHRKGVDDAGMELVSVVNCTYDQKPPNWTNAVWHEDRMWYGQVKNGSGKFESYSRYLDVIAHELSHGVTRKTAKLKYLHQSGALDESFSDIFGIVVKNLNGPNPKDVSKWDWEIGSGLKDGGPLRDLSDPKRVDQPDHMDDYAAKPDADDFGGVHTNSGIPNKAAYNVFMAKDPVGDFLFEPEDVAFLYYRTLLHLTEFATFKQLLTTLLTVVKTLTAGHPQAEIDMKTQAVEQAYADVGIV